VPPTIALGSRLRATAGDWSPVECLAVCLGEGGPP
jgi:hypothetical protein